MLTLSMRERRRRWEEYCRRLDAIMNAAAKPGAPLTEGGHLD